MIRSQLVFIMTLSLSYTSLAIAEEYEGMLVWSKRVELSTPVSGVVQKVFSQSGTIVGKGEVLVQLDPRAFKADLKSAKAKLKSSKGVNEEAQRELDRQTDMYERSMLSDHDLQVAKNNLTTARSAYLQAQAALTNAKLHLEYSAIRSPFNAVVIKLNAVKGQVVAAEVNPPVLVVVAEASRMLARFYVVAEKLSELVLNQGVNINIAGVQFQGKVKNIALEPDKLKSTHYAVDIIFDTKEKLLRAGQKVTINI